MLASAVKKILDRLRQLRDDTDAKIEALSVELDNTDPRVLVSLVHQTAIDFGDCLTFIMEGQLAVKTNAMTLAEELEAFHEYHKTLGSKFMLLPNEDFGCIEDYLDCLKHDIKVPSMDIEINGGAAFRRMMFEVEMFCRFAEITSETRKQDVVQARGVEASGVMTWRQVVVKILSVQAHLGMRQRVSYIGERIKWFFCMQKEVILDFMLGLKTSSCAHLYSKNFPKSAEIIESNEMIRQLIYEAYDKAVDRQLELFLEMFYSMLAATFSDPWVFLKRASMDAEEAVMDDVSMPSFDETKARIPLEIESRSGIENILDGWLADIPLEPLLVDEAVEKAQMMIIKLFTFIRAQISDVVELFTETFFKLKMMRRLGDDMRAIQLNAADLSSQKEKQKELRENRERLRENASVLADSI